MSVCCLDGRQEQPKGTVIYRGAVYKNQSKNCNIQTSGLKIIAGILDNIS